MNEEEEDEQDKSQKSKRSTTKETISRHTLRVIGVIYKFQNATVKAISEKQRINEPKDRLCKAKQKDQIDRGENIYSWFPMLSFTPSLSLSLFPLPALPAPCSPGHVITKEQRTVWNIKLTEKRESLMLNDNNMS